MQSNIYTAFLGFTFFILLNFIGLPNVQGQGEGDIFDLRFLTELDCGENILTANIQIRSQDNTFKIGISSVLFNYEETVLEFLDYQSLNFDKNNICIPGVPLAVWDDHQFSSSTPGVFNLTLLTEIASQSCPIIERDWIDIGVIRFTVKNMERSPNMQFDTRNTSFNRNEPNDGTMAPNQGDLMGFNEVLAAQCGCSAPTLTTDNLAFDCSQTTVEINVLTNDIATNPTISIVNNPTKGTASLSPSGMLTYTPTTAFCGEDALTYRVCNDGKEDCCSDAIVSIAFSDNVLPTFTDAPSDLTIDCSELQEMGDIQATDNCAIVDITKNERIEAGDCPGDKTHIRTWTAVDICGNEATHTQLISLIDNVEPTIECPETFSILCGEVGAESINSGQPTVGDNCTNRNDLEVTFNDEVVTENCENFIQKQLTRTWTVVDACGNSATCTQTINIIDDIAPEMSCPRGLTVDCGQSINPDSLGSKPTATDNCSAVTMTFVDDESMPTDCNFDTKTITRTWTAVDACGNSTTCTQVLTIHGAPCPEPTTRNLVVYRCEKDIIDFKAILTDEENVIINIFNKSDLSPITNIQQYELPTTGCEISRLEFKYELYNLQECLLKSGNLTIKTIPNFIGETQLSEDGCTASLILECPDLYSVTWIAGSDSGEGTTYTATPETSGEVVFSVIFTGVDLSNETADLPCVEKLYRVNFNCGTNCPTTENQQVDLMTCAGQNLDVGRRLNLFEDSLDYRFILADSTLGIGFGATPWTIEVGNPFGCDRGFFTVIADGYDANQCLIKTIIISIQVLPKIEASFQYETDSIFCSPQLVLECPLLYKVDWKDNLGNSGVGNKYTGADGTDGFVAFYVYPIEERFSELPCAVDSFFVDFSCTIDCPRPSERTETITACAESEIDIIEWLDLRENKRNAFDNDKIINGIYKVGNPFGCELGTKTLTLKCFDENQCLVETITLNIKVIPVIYGEVMTTADVACGLFLSLECPENYIISWEDSNGDSGRGANYTGTANTAGTVVFTVDYLLDTPVLSSDSLHCFSQTFEATYNCLVDCPGTSTEERTVTVCNGDRLDIPAYLDLSPNFRYNVTGIELDDANNFEFINETCTVKSINFTAELLDGDCIIKVISVTANILPKAEGHIQYLSDSTYCTPKLSLACEDAFEVTWADNLGNTGSGNLYEGATGTTGFVTFYVSPLDSLSEIFCGVDTFFADYNCQTIDCPKPAFESVDVYGCAGELFNLFEHLQFSENTLYRVANDDVEDLKNIRLENDGTDCFISQFRVAIEVMDERACLLKTIFVSFNVLPKITGDITNKEENCGLILSLTCPNIYTIAWEDNLGNQGEGFSYEPELGTTGVVNFIVTYKDTTIAPLFADSSCYITTFQQEFACCNPVGTTCDDGDALTFKDVEDGNCGCFGTGCNLEHKGTVIDGSQLDACDLLIEMSDGTILEPQILPVGETLIVGQEIIFSFVERSGTVSICQRGKIVQIICLENTCPEAGTPCTDNNLATINDEQDGNCNCVGEMAPEIKSEIDLRFRPELDCRANTYCLTLQAKAQQEDFTIGTSSIMLNYDPNALEFASYAALQFDEKETCIGGTTSPWDEQKIDGTSVPGKFCLTMTLLTDSISCPEITTQEWVDMGVICFDIMNNDTTPNIRFDSINTHFNSSSPNDGTRPITLGTLHGIDTDIALACEGNTIVAANELALKAILQGPYNANKELMADDLRKKGFIPLTEPYTGIPSFVHFGEGGGEAITLNVLEENGDNAIVDWVFLELRSDVDSTLVMATRSALIQRDGDVVDVDGESNVRFVVPDGDYYVCIKHRNHLGVMTAKPVSFVSAQTTSIDFTTAETDTYGAHAQLDIEGKMVLRGGNANPDKFIILAGGGLGLPDRDMIFFDIFLSLWQSNPGIPITYNSVLHGYYGSDTNMDGKVKYQGPKNDIDAYIFFNVLFHPQNTSYRLNFAISEQIP